MLRTKIVCTIGPASRSPELLRELIANGILSAHIGNPPVEELDLRLGLGDGAARQDISHAHPPSRIKIGHDDEFLGPGWHLLESSASGAHFRWTSELSLIHISEPTRPY